MGPENIHGGMLESTTQQSKIVKPRLTNMEMQNSCSDIDIRCSKFPLYKGQNVKNNINVSVQGIFSRSIPLALKLCNSKWPCKIVFTLASGGVSANS